MRLFLHDVSHAYLQKKEKLSRPIFIQPKKADIKLFEIEDGQLFELRKPLHGLCDAEHYWGYIIKDSLANGLGMKSLYSDAALYVKSGKNKAERFLKTYVDDSLNSGFEIFQSLAKKSTTKFERKPRVYDNFDFYRTQLKTVAGGSFPITQDHYAKNLSTFSLNSSFQSF